MSLHGLDNYRSSWMIIHMYATQLLSACGTYPFQRREHGPALHFVGGQVDFGDNVNGGMMIAIGQAGRMPAAEKYWIPN